MFIRRVTKEKVTGGYAQRGKDGCYGIAAAGDDGEEKHIVSFNGRKATAMTNILIGIILYACLNSWLY
jgi:hypothetical protein